MPYQSPSQRAAIPAGDLCHQVELWKKADVPAENVLGEPQEGATKVAVLWAGVSRTGGRAFMLAQQLRASLSHQVTIRFYAGLEPIRFFFVFRGRRLNIAKVTDIEEMRTTMVCYCEEANTPWSPT